MGLQIAQGDLVHADRHGAIVIPPEVLADLGSAIYRLERTEQIILGPAKSGALDFDAFQTAWAAFERSRT
jgi:regulator of RNase E activity RraA